MTEVYGGAKAVAGRTSTGSLRTMPGVSEILRAPLAAFRSLRLALLGGVVAMSACERTQDSSGAPDRPIGADHARTSDQGEPRTAPLRIVSLSPAITTTIEHLGAGDRIVGRSPWCRTSGSAAVTWDGASVDAERLVALAPSHILLQRTVAVGPQEEIRRLAAGRPWKVHDWRLDRLDEVRMMIEGVASELGLADSDRAMALLERFDRACVRDEAIAAMGPALLLFGADPPMAFGPGSYVDDLWLSLGGENVVTRGAYPELSVEETRRLDPRWVVVIGSEALAARVATLPIRALREGRVLVVSDPGLLEPGAGVIDAVESLRHEVSQRVSTAQGQVAP
ncbi:MAG: ABC transporter substrate-binding protein [Phycisphaeraceae bacterium]|nr:ABC transporter substrate-binding protein [Phycisphaeraceae bacterium]